MFEKTIKFIATKHYLENNKDVFPVPSKVNIPDWFKKLEHKQGHETVKGCIPFLDTLTAGYIIKMPVDYFIEHNIDLEGKKQTGYSSAQINFHKANEVNLNYNKTNNFHKTYQFRGSPIESKNKNLPVHKIHNPWIIKTPPGYSCLFLPPMNNHDDRFSIIPGIVDTDTYNIEINFPFVVNGDKYPSLRSLIKRGTPIVQVIPFKREQWRMKMESIDQEERLKDNFYLRKYIIDNYKKLFWRKKSWK